MKWQCWGGKEKKLLACPAWIFSMSLHHFQTEAPCPASKRTPSLCFLFLPAIISHVLHTASFFPSWMYMHTVWVESFITSLNYTERHRWLDSGALWFCPGLPASVNTWQREEKKGEQTDTVYTDTDTLMKWVSGFFRFTAPSYVTSSKKKLRMNIWLIAAVL